MAVTGYFIDQDWNFREVLLGFEPLHGTHSGVNLGEVLLKLFQKYNITNRVLAVTTDNASNNTTLIKSVQKAIDSLDLQNQAEIVRMPCIAHVIQLSVKELLGKLKADPKNDFAERVWNNAQAQSLHNPEPHENSIIHTLRKVGRRNPFISLITYSST